MYILTFKNSNGDIVDLGGAPCIFEYETLNDLDKDVRFFHECDIERFYDIFLEVRWEPSFDPRKM